MPARTLPTLTRAEVEAHSSAKSCYVTIGSNVYDVTDFVGDHPGGGDLILKYAGRDVEHILKDATSHAHSEAAYEVLDESLVGFVVPEKAVNGSANGKAAAKTANGRANGKANGKANGSAAAAASPSSTSKEELMDNGDGTLVHPRTGMSCEEDLSKETDIDKDFQRHHFLDLSKPLFVQVWNGGFKKDFYLEQVHRPRHYKGGKSAPLFGNFLEPLTMTPWWVVPTLWLPPVAYGTYLAGKGLSAAALPAYWLFGLFLWTLVEYILHRFLFHLD